VHWPGGSEIHQRLVGTRASIVLAYGREESIDALAESASQRVLRFGPRLSVALVSREAVNPSTAATAARQVALFDQQGCLSPHYVLVEDTAGASDAFVTALAASLGDLA